MDEKDVFKVYHDRVLEIILMLIFLETLSMNRRNPTKVIETTEQYLDIEINKKKKVPLKWILLISPLRE